MDINGGNKKVNIEDTSEEKVIVNETVKEVVEEETVDNVEKREINKVEIEHVQQQ